MHAGDLPKYTTDDLIIHLGDGTLAVNDIMTMQPGPTYNYTDMLCCIPIET